MLPSSALFTVASFRLANIFGCSDFWCSWHFKTDLADGNLPNLAEFRRQNLRRQHLRRQSLLQYLRRKFCKLLQKRFSRIGLWAIKTLQPRNDATALSISTFSTMTLSITTLSIAIIKCDTHQNRGSLFCCVLTVTYAECHYSECRYAEASAALVMYGKWTDFKVSLAVLIS